MLLTDELSRAGSGGFVWNVIGGFGIGCPPLVKFGKKELVKRILPGILNGDKRICLAITEPDAGSDVANLGCEAVLSEDGKHYIVNGEKKWITNGVFCDYFVTACKTKKGYSVILVPRGEGVTTTPIKTSYSTAAGTTFIEFDNVKVPTDHLLGQEDNGFVVIMANFNHERYTMACGAVRKQRLIVEECLKWSNQRIIFGKKLIDQPVIRQK